MSDFVDSCPRCDSADLRACVSSIQQEGAADHDHRCNQCGHTFDRPERRPRKGPGSLHGLAKRLDDTSTDDLRADGGVPETLADLASTCESCGDDVAPERLEDGECPGCVYGEPVTDGGVDVSDGTGAIDSDWEDAEPDYEERLAAALDGVQTEPMAGGLAIDLVTRQVLFVRRVVADTLAEYYESEGFDLATYKQHAYLPVRSDDTVYECVFAGDIDSLHTNRKTYDYPRGRLAHCPVEQAWTDAEVGGL